LHVVNKSNRATTYSLGIIKKQERKLTSANRSFYTLAGRSRGSVVCSGLFDF